MNWARELVCSRSGARAPLARLENLSPAGAPWMVEYDLDPQRGARLRASLRHGRAWTLWRYRELLPLGRADDRIDLGEGGTPLIEMPLSVAQGGRLWVKQEAGNPTGSFKARGLSLAVNRARELGAPGIRLPSAGNAAIAAAAYAAACDLPCRVAVPEDTPDAVRERCLASGAEVHVVGSTLVESGHWLNENAPDYLDVSTLREPYRLEGKKTMGLELAEQFGWNLPEWILYPTGGGTGLIGMVKAFDELERLELIGSRRPKMVAVQMEGCAPIVKAFSEGREEAEPWLEATTRVWGLRVPKAIGDFLILKALRSTHGLARAVPEGAAETSQKLLTRKTGLDWGLEGAACHIAFLELRDKGVIADSDRVVLFQTGHPANYG